MPIKYKASAGGEGFKTVSAGNYVAICNIVADLGMQPGYGAYPDPKPQVYLRFEIPEERVDYEKDGKRVSGPIVIGRSLTASMSEKANLRKLLENWRGKQFTDLEASEFDVASVLGVACMLSVTESNKDGKTYSNISSIAALPKGFPKPKAENELLYYAEDNKTAYPKLPEWLRGKIDSQIKPQSYKDTSVPDWDYDPISNDEDADPVPF